MFGPQKAVNGPRVRRISQSLLQRFEDQPPPSGTAVLDAFAALCVDAG